LCWAGPDGFLSVWTKKPPTGWTLLARFLLRKVEEKESEGKVIKENKENLYHARIEDHQKMWKKRKDIEGVSESSV
jgi:hypothetical protein